MNERALTAAPKQAVSVTPAVSSLLQRKCTCGNHTVAGGECAECRKKREASGLQRSAMNSAPIGSVPPIVHDVLRSPGQPLDASVRAHLEPRFGHDFSRVRVHTDPRAAESARAVNAQAYTVGQNIVFDHGRYRPQENNGRHLLAHELAHTLQQRGVQRFANDVQVMSAVGDPLEREAERVARAVTSEVIGVRSPQMQTHFHTVSPVLSRLPGTEPDDPGLRKEKLKEIGVEEDAEPPTGVEAGIKRFKVLEAFLLPGEKGPFAEKVWQAKADAGALESVIDVAGNSERVKTALKQERPDTKTLRKIWLTKVRWSEADAAANWQKAGGDSASFEPPQSGKMTCEMDHIVELQIGGTNIPENMQALDSSPNRSSGAAIKTILADKAKAIRGKVPGLQNVILHYDRVNQAGVLCGPCCEVEKKAQALAGKVEGVTSEGVSVERYEIKAGGSKADIMIGGAEQKDKKLPVAIRESAFMENKAAATIIPGMVLNSLHRSAKASDTIDADIDAGTGTKLPISLDAAKGKGSFTMIVNRSTRVLTLSPKAKHPNIAFTYPHLSNGKITELQFGEAGLSGKGQITPSIPLLGGLTLKVEFSPNEFKLAAPIPKDKLKIPIPGFTVTQADLSMVLAPEFKPEGTIAFAIGPKAKPVANGILTASVDSQGFLAKGELTAKVPGLDETTGTVAYRKQTGWEGEIRLTTSRIPGVQNALVVVSLSDAGLVMSGGFKIGLPGDQSVDLSVIRRGQLWVFSGKGEFKAPLLGPVQLSFEHDGEHLRGTGRTRIEIHGIKGDLLVAYKDGRVTGDAKLRIQKGRATGDLNVHLSERHKFSGEGSIQYQVTPNLIATAGIVLDEAEKVTLKGALEFPKPIKLFEGFNDKKPIFKAGITIPIPGVSLGGVGLVLRIDGGIAVSYGIGPGELRNAKIAAAMNPLEENPDLDIKLGALLYIPAHAGISGSIRGALAIDAFVASVSGGLTVIASADLDGKVQAQVDIQYSKSRFALDASAGIDAGLILGLGLDADILAKAGFGWLSAEEQWVWHLAAYKYDTGLKFGMKAPLHYASDEPFKPPSLSDITWITPEINVSDMLSKIVRRAMG